MVIELLLLIFLFLYIILRIIIGIFFDSKDIELKKIKKGIIFLNKKDFIQAIIFFDKYILLHPTATYAYTYRAKCQLGLKKYEEAIIDSTIANTFKETIPEAFLYKGIAHYKLSQFEKALIELNKSVRYLKNNADAYKWRGLVNLKLNLIEKAESDFIKSKDLGDEDSNFILNHHYLIEI